MEAIMGNDSKREYITILRLRYSNSTKKQKSIILDEFCATFNHNRKYAIRVLQPPSDKAKTPKGRKKKYSPECEHHLRKLWMIMDQMCSKRMAAAMPMWIPFYEVDESLRKELLSMSPATIDRTLHPFRSELSRKLRSGTKPGRLIKNQIPIKPFDFNIQEPGFVEADTVAHCGNSLSGEFIWSITLTDIYSGWTENRAVMGKGSAGVLSSLKDMEKALPFPLKGFNSDNGSELLNYHILRFLKDKGVEHTRSRAYKKNDNCHVEQKNWTHVRQIFGYERFDQRELIPLMNEFYCSEQSLLQNFFFPQVKLIRKIRIGSKYKFTYSKPLTPYQRLMACEAISNEKKDYLKAIFDTLNPIELKSKRQEKIKNFLKVITKKFDQKNVA